MAYDEILAERIRKVMDQEQGTAEKKMFGGIGFFIHGNMACGVHKDMLVVRAGPDSYQEMIKSPHTHPFDITGKTMKGWIMVEPAGFKGEDDFQQWVSSGINFALTLPPK
ncbi:MAG: TfoX/Sxy family protein [Chloroflexota bacterium]|nr:MAG: TfoX/Sxy family protein [Chloroflexota bacterium]